MLSYKKPSNYLIVLSLIIISLGFLMSYLVYTNVKHLQYSAKLINETGILPKEMVETGQRFIKKIWYAVWEFKNKNFRIIWVYDVIVSSSCTIC